MKDLRILKNATQLIVCLMALLAATGCNRENATTKTTAHSEIGKLRHTLFVECMELAAKMPRQADDDVSDIVGECSNEAYYIANHMTD